MKKLIIISILLIASTSWGMNCGFMGSISGTGTGGGGTCSVTCSTTGMVICQNLETATTGWDNSETWYKSGTADPICTASPSPLRGTQSLKISQYSSETSSAFTASGDVYFHFLFAAEDATPGSTGWISYLITGSSTYVAGIKLNTAGHLVAYYGSAYSSAGSTTLANNTAYHIWGYYHSNAGAGIMRVWIAEASTKTRPTSAEVEVTNGADANDVDKIMVTAEVSSSVYHFDQIMVSTADFSCVP
jgi:hypothetical protein